MTLDEGPGAHRREVEQAQARGHHPPSPLRQPWRDPLDEAHEYVTDLELELAALEDQAAGIRRTLAAVREWRDRYDPDDRQPTADPRMFDLGTDQTERAS